WSGSPSRWGDYSKMSVDPSAAMTFWYTQEYYSTSSQANWKTRVGSFSFINILSAHGSASPNLLCPGMSTQLDINASGGSGVYTYSWTSVPAGFTSNIKNPVATPTVTTQYVAHVNDGTQTKTDTVLVTIQGEPVAFAGNDTVYPNATPAFPVIGIAENYSHVLWTSSSEGLPGGGHFLNDTLLGVLFFPGDLDRANCGVTLTLHVYALAPCTDSTSDAINVALCPVGFGKLGNQPFGIRLLPNPNKGIFVVNIKGARDQDVNISVADYSGKIYSSEWIKPDGDNFKKNMNLSSLPAGSYFVKAQTGAEVKTEKLIIR
ncbi:MAG: T9SS type A sorting domain-containing protein, partial [Bacteroidota bacterium]